MGDILQRQLPEILERKVRAAADLIPHRVRYANATNRTDGL